jgi:3-hydroxyisobutyrate dehydrogenase
MRSRDFDPPRAYTRQLYKDLKNVRAFASGLGLALPMVDAAAAQYLNFVQAGNQMADPASIVRHCEAQNHPRASEQRAVGVKTLGSTK